MRERGDLEQGRGRFCVQLPKTRPIVRSRRDAPSFARIGMNVTKGNGNSGLVVLEADHGLQKKTPVAQLNREEERQAARDECEVHVSYAIRPGDRIREVHAEALDKTLKTLGQCHAEQDDEQGMDKKTMSASAMLAELNIATSETSPRVINLSVSRNLENVLVAPCIAPNGSRPPSRPSTLDCVTLSPPSKRRRSASLSSLSTVTSKSATPPRSSLKQQASPLRHDGNIQVLPAIRQRALPTLKVC